MQRDKVVRFLRIAVSAVCGIVCVLLVVLWVRSYWWADILRVGNGFVVISAPGAFGLDSPPNDYVPKKLSASDFNAKSKWPSRVWGTFRFNTSPTHPYFCIPYWFATLLTATFTVLASGIQRRSQFSVRTLLLATTLIAVVLGLVTAYLRLW
jgi:hypothetical protein